MKTIDPIIIAQASMVQDIDAALLPVQAALGVKYGDFAGVFFSGNKYNDWSTVSPLKRLEWLAQYAQSEIAFDMPLYLREFPGFVLDVAIPAGFDDESYHNDTCPSFGHPLRDGMRLKVYIEDYNPDKWEGVDYRFNAYMYDKDGDQLPDVCSTDDWSRMTDYLTTTVQAYK